jgi:hypothetical protein
VSVTIFSAQSGYWHDSSTWTGGVVPNPSNDDVVIMSGHTVEAHNSIYLDSGRSLMVQENGQLDLYANAEFTWGSMLDISGGLALHNWNTCYLYGELYLQNSGWLDVYAGYLYLESDSKYLYGAVYVGGSGSLYISYYCNAYVYGSLFVDWSGYVYLYYNAYLYLEGGSSTTIQGYVSSDYYSSLYVYGNATINSGGGLTLYYGSYLQVESGGLLTLAGWIDAYDGSSAYVVSGGQMLIERDGGMGVSYYASLTVDGVVDAFGSFSIGYDAYLSVYGRVRVYRSLYISGEMYGGGRIDMMRRESRIYDYNGNSLIFFDQAHGFGQTLIA